MSEIPTSKGKQFIKENSNKKVSKDAAEQLVQELEAYALERADQAVAEAEKEGRKTIRKEDITASQA